VMLVGTQRARARATAEAIAAQTRANAIELIVVDLCPAAPRLPDLGLSRMSQIVLPRSTPWGSARAAGVRAAKSPVVAFIEDHCTPEPGWAEALLKAHREPWATVGYAYLGGGARWSSRVGLIAEYGLWAHPAAGGRSWILPGNNVSYKRDLLLDLGEKLEPALRIDNNLHRRFAARGLEGAIEPRALVRHHELATVRDMARANHSYGRLLAVDRARDEGWSQPRRALYAIAAPLGGPVFRTARLARSMDGHGPPLRLALTALPGAALVWFWSAIGQALGCLFGPGHAERRLVAWELDVDRPGALPQARIPTRRFPGVE
jgi:hypothetical protein